MADNRLSINEFKKVIADEYFLLEVSKHIFNYFETFYNKNTSPTILHKASLQHIILKELKNNDIIISNNYNTFLTKISRQDIKKQIINEGIKTTLKAKFTNIFEINHISKKIFFINVENEVLFDILMNYVVDIAVNKKTNQNAIIVVNIELNQNTDLSYLYSTINKAIRKKLPIIFLVWGKNTPTFYEIDGKHSFYRNFNNIIANYPPNKVSYENLTDFNYFFVKEKLKKLLIKTRNENIPAILFIPEIEFATTKNKCPIKLWVKELNIFKDKDIELIYDKAKEFAKSILSESYYEKFLYDLCKCVNKHENCTPKTGIRIIENIKDFKEKECLLKKYDFLKDLFSSFTSNNKTTELSLPVLPKMRQASYITSKLLLHETFIANNIPENELIYNYLSLIDNTFLLDLPASKILLKNIKNTKLFEAIGAKQVTSNMPNTKGLYFTKKSNQKA